MHLSHSIMALIAIHTITHSRGIWIQKFGSYLLIITVFRACEWITTGMSALFLRYPADHRAGGSKQWMPISWSEDTENTGETLHANTSVGCSLMTGRCMCFCAHYYKCSLFFSTPPCHVNLWRWCLIIMQHNQITGNAVKDGYRDSWRLVSKHTHTHMWARCIFFSEDAREEVPPQKRWMRKIINGIKNKTKLILCNMKLRRRLK